MFPGLCLAEYLTTSQVIPHRRPTWLQDTLLLILSVCDRTSSLPGFSNMSSFPPEPVPAASLAPISNHSFPTTYIISKVVQAFFTMFLIPSPFTAEFLNISLYKSYVPGKLSVFLLCFLKLSQTKEQFDNKATSTLLGVIIPPHFWYH